jgi:hypothetical protein
MKTPNELRKVIREFQRSGVVSACVLISPDKSDIIVLRSDRCDFAALMFLLEDEWQFFALLSIGRDQSGERRTKFQTLAAAEGVSSAVLQKALDAFNKSVIEDGVFQPKTVGGLH